LAGSRRSGVEHERALVREAWEKGFFAIRAAGSGSGTSAYPKPDLIIFRPGGVVDVVQVKTTRKNRVRFTPRAWADEVRAARRLRALGFQVRVWLNLKILKPGRPREAMLRIDGHEEEALVVDYDAKRDLLRYKWREPQTKRHRGESRLA